MATPVPSTGPALNYSTWQTWWPGWSGGDADRPRDTLRQYTDMSPAAGDSHVTRGLPYLPGSLWWTRSGSAAAPCRTGGCSGTPPGTACCSAASACTDSAAGEMRSDTSDSVGGRDAGTGIETRQKPHTLRAHFSHKYKSAMRSQEYLDDSGSSSGSKGHFDYHPS